jgi:ribonuclease G
MKKEIIINVEPNETRIGIREDGQLVEYMVERSGQRLSVGDIYKARVTAVLPGMQAAFLDIGYEKSAFLHVSDLSIETKDFEDIEERFEGKQTNDTWARTGMCLLSRCSRRVMNAWFR